MSGLITLHVPLIWAMYNFGHSNFFEQTKFQTIKEIWSSANFLTHLKTLKVSFFYKQLGLGNEFKIWNNFES
jgi:hypothetical protein